MRLYEREPGAQHDAQGHATHGAWARAARASARRAALGPARSGAPTASAHPPLRGASRAAPWRVSGEHCDEHPGSHNREESAVRDLGNHSDRHPAAVRGGALGRLPKFGRAATGD